MKINSGVDRLVLLTLAIVFIQHLCACLWIMIGTEELSNSKNGWLQNDTLNNDGGFNTYLTAFYFIVTTMSTVGYGDMSAGTGVERNFCVFIMMFGVFVFSIMTGSMASVLSSMDEENSVLTQKLMFLNKIQVTYRLDSKLYQDIRRTLKYDSSHNIKGLNEFIDELPPKLQIGVSI